MSVIDPRRHSRLDAPEALLASERTPANSESSIESDLCFEIIDRIARRIAPIHGTLVASPEYVRQHGAPKTTDQLLAQQCLVQGIETWHFVDRDKTIALHPQGRFQADNALSARSQFAVRLFPV